MPGSGQLLQLYPQTGEQPLPGLYLCQDLRGVLASSPGSLVYTNFVTSLDGRIALQEQNSGRSKVPRETANPRDWRLFLELSAPADAIVMSGRYLRDLADGQAKSLPPFSEDIPQDIRDYREKLGLSPEPALVFVTRSLDLPDSVWERLADRTVLVATGESSPGKLAPLQDRGIEVLVFETADVKGRALIEDLSRRGYRLIYSIAGPEVMHTLLAAGVIWRIYLTTVTRVLGGEVYATLTRGPKLQPVRDFELNALYLDRYGPDGVGQLLQVYSRKSDP